MNAIELLYETFNVPHDPDDAMSLADRVLSETFSDLDESTAGEFISAVQSGEAAILELETADERAKIEADPSEGADDQIGVTRMVSAL